MTFQNTFDWHSLPSLVVRDTISESVKVFQIFSRRARRPWKRFGVCAASIAGHPPSSFLCEIVHPQNTSLILLISEPIRFNVFSFVIFKRGNWQYREQLGNQYNYYFIQSQPAGSNVMKQCQYHLQNNSNCSDRRGNARIALYFQTDLKILCEGKAN